MEKTVENLYHSLQKLLGLHRQLLETIRLERQVLIQADLKAIQTLTCNKHALIESIHQAEQSRLNQVIEHAVLWKKNQQELTLSQIIIEIQGRDPTGANQLRSACNALSILIQRISDQNSENQSFISKSIEHLNQMKSNILGEGAPRSTTYNQNAQKTSRPQTHRLLSKEI